MKTLIAASALTLFANSALAFNIYGGFSNPDISSNASNAYGVEIPVTSRAVSSVPDSLGEYYAGNPDVDHGRIPGYVPIRDFGGPLYTSLDELTFGNPDSGLSNRFEMELEPRFGVDSAIVSSDDGDDGGA